MPEPSPELPTSAALHTLVAPDALRRSAAPPGTIRSVSELPPIVEFAFPGALRDQLIAAILTGEKTATTGLAVEWEIDGDPLPSPGELQTVIDSDERPVAIIELLRVEPMRLADVGLDVAIGEGEGYTSVAEWRASHEAFWNSFIDELRAAPGHAEFALTDDTEVVVEWFRLVRPLDPAESP